MKSRLAISFLLILINTPYAAGQTTARRNLDWPALADKIVERLALQPGEKVLLVAYPGLFESLIPHLRYAVTAAGATDLGVIDVRATPYPDARDADVLARSDRAARQAYRDMFADIDVAVKLPGALPEHPAYSAMQDVLNSGRGRVIHFHWLEAGSAMAVAGQPLPPLFAIDAVYEAAVLETDYDAIAQQQERFVQAMRDAQVRVTSPWGTDIRFRIGDRPVNRQDGHAGRKRADMAVTLIDREFELPCGAIRVAPLEASVEGVIAIPISQWSGQPVMGLKLRFAAGSVVDVTADSGIAAVQKEMDAGGSAARGFREFALGFNPKLAVPEHSPWIPYYGYGAGVVRLSLGDNSELGGAVRGNYVRWNFFADATVTVGDAVWVRDGKLRHP
jgi:leucyl aminopeptidase (aminopeptidase T)